ncbi:nucleotidyl transferase AbiEii/AbiGii toxin family protein [uncultured Ruminococcus sp.]|uniref:nucleotidyl transferase AbiEii/AbiGii toxin family protein n=1 Tax=uncultured Ruminococcus sp. TaxID=165186 RepID=UPI00292CFB3C|nr:nucleotidyl transferase AbiEii/AbiGii toxin family protein [uncultured Ruminococcus sp.]
MNITAEEKLMYEIMKAIYESGIPVSFKGSMVLKACLMEAGYNEETRHTVDIDANWNTETSPTGEQMVESLQKAIDQSGLGLKISLYRMYGERRSAGFEVIDPTADRMLFTMDIDVNRPKVPTQIYEVTGFRFRGVSPIQMIADKTAVVSSEKVFRRIKDVVDLYYLSGVFKFNRDEVLQTLSNNNRQLDTFDGFLHKTEDLRHSYEKFRFEGDVFKPPFDEVYLTVRKYIKEVLPRERHRVHER